MGFSMSRWLYLEGLRWLLVVGRADLEVSRWKSCQGRFAIWGLWRLVGLSDWMGGWSGGCSEMDAGPEVDGERGNNVLVD